MKRTSIIAASATLLVLATAAGGDAAPKYQPFPPGYGYLNAIEIRALMKAVADGDHKTVRQHGWKLWAGIMQPSTNAPGWPIWYTWPNTTAAFAPSKPPAGALLSSVQGAPKKSRILLSIEAGAGQAAGATIPVNVPEIPCYQIPQPVVQTYKNATSLCGKNNICDGSHFQFNGDIMIATESLSSEAFKWIRSTRVYEQAKLNELRKKGVKDLALPPPYVVTKHMFWPVKAGQISAIPVWHREFDPSDPKYAGYETWPDLVAVDPSGKSVGTTVPVSFLYGVWQFQPPPDPNKDPNCKMQTPFPTVTGSATVYALKDFYYHQVTQADWVSFDEADKAIINAASYWAYNKPFGVGDYLVTIAMHVNTKEIPSWALQSAWWSDQPNSGQYSEDRPALPQAKGPWFHYLLVDAYGIPDPKGSERLPVATNPYIELVTHPMGTDCNNCHFRSGWPTFSHGGTAGYQNPTCPDLLQKFTPNPLNACFAQITRSDFQWIIPDRALAPPK